MRTVLRVTVEELNDQGAVVNSERAEVPDHNYLLLVTGNCVVDGVQSYPKSGTHVVTIKNVGGRRLAFDALEEKG